MNFCNSVLKILAPMYLSWPSDNEKRTIKAGFQAIQGFQNCIGAIDCTHVYMKSPCGERSGDYRDRNSQFSTVMQVVVDHRMKFLHVSTEYPGSIHDLRVLSLSSLWLNKATYFNGPEIKLPNSTFEIPEYIVGDAGYVICEHIMTPVRGRVTGTNEKFNKKHSQTRIVVERTFSKWKNTWGYFDSKINRPKINFLYHLMTATCVLHNMLIELGDLQTAVAHDTPFVSQVAVETNRSYGQSTIIGGLMRDEMKAFLCPESVVSEENVEENEDEDEGNEEASEQTEDSEEDSEVSSEESDEAEDSD